ncbi:PD40 domain-containing protein [Catenulispora pinisilvae]|uniref:PD40 domain-containing protein n=1 Tax=Catenulispora pinisilvae TaxID=2705253 RepID=UPI001891FFE3|nr:PD40 domain-containing protein [Catenulispora pinisilvae]
MPITESPHRTKIFIASVSVLLTIAVVAVIVAYQGRPTARAGIKGTVVLDASSPLNTGSGYLVYKTTVAGPDFGTLAERRLSGAATTVTGAPTLSSIQCDRSYTAAGILLCLRADGNLVRVADVEVYDRNLKPIKKLQAAGIPNRARLSADGRMAAWTTFVAGDAYNGPAFSTRTSVLDLKTGALSDSIESFAVTLQGRPYHAVDENVWGVTFAADDNTFYATLGTGGRTWLVRGDVAARTLTTVTDNVECPSLSPDGKSIVFKKRVSDDAWKMWRLEVLNLTTMAETPLAETRSVDDQAAWLDDHTVMYAVPQTSGSGYDVWSTPADGSGQPSLLARDAFSPSVTSG